MLWRLRDYFNNNVANIAHIKSKSLLLKFSPSYLNQRSTVVEVSHEFISDGSFNEIFMRINLISCGQKLDPSIYPLFM